MFCADSLEETQLCCTPSATNPTDPKAVKYVEALHIYTDLKAIFQVNAG